MLCATRSGHNLVIVIIIVIIILIIIIIIIIIIYQKATTFIYTRIHSHIHLRQRTIPPHITQLSSAGMTGWLAMDFRHSRS